MHSSIRPLVLVFFSAFLTLGLNAQSLDQSEGYWQWRHSLMVNPETDSLTEEDVFEARRELREHRESSSTARALGLNWTLLGPKNLGGRTRSLIVDQSNPDNLFAGSVAGGLFFSEDGGDSWEPHPQNEEFESLVVGAIAQSASGDIYFGTGESYTGLYDGSASFTRNFTGAGVFKSSDAGLSFDLLPSTDPVGDIAASEAAQWAYVNRIACHPSLNDVVVAATRLGLKLSDDSGATWTDIAFGNCEEALFDSEGRLHAIAGNRYYRSVDTLAPSVVVEVADVPWEFAASRVLLAVSPVDVNKVYAYASGGGSIGEFLGVWQSTDGGDTWTLILDPADGIDPVTVQGFYNMSIAADPVDPDGVVVGGQLSIWRYSGGVWDQIADALVSPSFPNHIGISQHVLTYEPGNSDQLYVGTSAGLFRSNNATAGIPSFEPMNNGYSTITLHGMDAGSCGQTLGGTQDNGTIWNNYSASDPFEAEVVIPGFAGGEAELSYARPDYLLMTTFGFPGIILSRSVNAGTSYSSPYDSNIDADGDGVCDDNCDFVQKVLLWEDYDRFNTFGDALFGTPVTVDGVTYALNDSVTYLGENFAINEESLYKSLFFHGTTAGRL